MTKEGVHKLLKNIHKEQEREKRKKEKGEEDEEEEEDSDDEKTTTAQPDRFAQIAVRLTTLYF